nr:type I restriction-modification system subunit M N-terminal domain-containing protein [Spirosomataceae bacterium]
MTAEQLKTLEDRLWEAANNLRQGAGVKASEYATPILGLIFLRFASIKFKKLLPAIEQEYEATKDSRRAREI